MKEDTDSAYIRTFFWILCLEMHAVGSKGSILFKNEWSSFIIKYWKQFQWQMCVIYQNYNKVAESFKIPV